MYHGIIAYTAALYMIYMLYFSAHCMSQPSSSTHCHTYRLPVNSSKLMSFNVFNEPSIDSITFRLVYWSMVHNYGSCVVHRRRLRCQRHYLTVVRIVAHGGHCQVTCASVHIFVQTLYFMVLVSDLGSF